MDRRYEQKCPRPLLDCEQADFTGCGRRPVFYAQFPEYLLQVFVNGSGTHIQDLAYLPVGLAVRDPE
jgi:hypothetical protein